MYAGKTTIEILERIEPTMDEKGTQPSQFQDRIIFMSMYNDIKYWIRTARTSIVTTQHESPSTHETSIQDIRLFLVLEMKISGTEDWPTNLTENGTQQRRLWKKSRRAGTLYSSALFYG